MIYNLRYVYYAYEESFHKHFYGKNSCAIIKIWTQNSNTFTRIKKIKNRKKTKLNNIYFKGFV